MTIDDRARAPEGAQPELLTISEVARRLSVGRDRVYLLLADGELTGTHLGRSHRVLARSLTDYIRRIAQ